MAPDGAFSRYLEGDPAKQQGKTPGNPAMDYWVDAMQRGVLFWDVMRQRGNQYLEQKAKIAPHVLQYTFEVVYDGLDLRRPVNYRLVRIIPDEGMDVDPLKRPYVIIDPRAGHGPGIGGFKADSEIGVAIRAGHPCYFIGFLPDPVPGQTIEDIANAEAIFLETVIAAHPQSEGKPCVVGNCQAGWAVMMLAAARPELFGPIILAGAPLSYWNGEHGGSPLRYMGGLNGGSWMSALVSDMGNGVFDGAWLVRNFENLNPTNTLWSKNHNLYSKIDSEAERYLAFEKWWGGHVLLGAEEIEFITDELFLGNKLSVAKLVTDNGVRLDLRDIRSPIIVFCSKGDNITPPPQALGWITDIYSSVDEIIAHRQTIIYTVHDSAGHLGIFVSGQVARKEHAEFANSIDLVDVLPPGLYEAVLVPKHSGMADAELTPGDYVVKFEQRTLDDIRAHGGNDRDDELAFATVKRTSDAMVGLYKTFFSHWVKSTATDQGAEFLRRMHPLRLSYELVSDLNPFMMPISSVAETVRENRKPVSPDNPYFQAQEKFSTMVEGWMDKMTEMRDASYEAQFFAIYGNPLLQALVGLRNFDTDVRRKPGDDAGHHAFVRDRLNRLVSQIEAGGLSEAVLRSLIYIRLEHAVGDERAFNLLRMMRNGWMGQKDMTLAEFKQAIRDQFLMLVVDEDRAIAAIPGMLPREQEMRDEAVAFMRDVMRAQGEFDQITAVRLAEIEKAFGVSPAPSPVPEAAPVKAAPIKPPPAKTASAKSAAAKPASAKRRPRRKTT